MISSYYHKFSLFKLIHAHHDHTFPGGRLVFRSIYEELRQECWWPFMDKDVYNWCQECQACQRGKTAHRRLELPTGNVPVQRPFERISVDSVEYKSLSMPAACVQCKCVLFILDHVTRFAMLTLIPNKSADTVSKALIDRIICVLDPP